MKTTIEMKKRGQVVIPKPIRKALDLEDGDIVSIDVEKYVKPQKP